MTRTTLSLPEDLLRRVRVLAAERRTSMADIIRQAVERELEGQRPRPQSLGIGESGHQQTSEEISDIRPKPR